MKLAIVDTETTGVNPKEDRIVQFTIVNYETATGEIHKWARMVNPGIPIPKEASEIHGITDEKVSLSPSFASYRVIVEDALRDAVIVGYNSKRFDTVILDAELRRNGSSGIDLETVLEIDVYHLWNQLEPRTLEGACKRWLKSAHKDAHNSEADALAAFLVLQALLRGFGLSYLDAIKKCETVDRYNRFIIKNGKLCFNFGKHKGKPIKECLEYANWILVSSFEEDTKQIIMKELQR